MLISLKPVYLSFLMLRLVLVLVVAIAVLLIFFPDRSIVSLGAAICIIGMSWSLYLNRGEVAAIEGEDDQVTFTFLNSSFFGQESLTLELKDIECKHLEDRIEVKHDGVVIAKLRKKAMRANEWEEVVGYFR